MDAGAGQGLVDEARDGAWRFATALAALPALQQVPAIARRDGEVLALGTGVIAAAPFARLIGRGEGADVGKNIRVLANGEFKFKLE